jgi:acetoin utilization protein AcuB
MRIGELMQTNVATIGEDDDLALALQVMRWRGIRHLPVLAGGRVVGMLTERALLQRLSSDGHRLTGTAGDIADRGVRWVRPDDDLAGVAAVLVTSQVDAVPVIDGETLVGIVTTTDVLSHVAQVPVSSRPHRDAESVMTSQVVAVHPGERLIDAAAVMVAEGTRHLPVVDGVNRIVGILSDRDVRTAIGNPLASAEGDPKAASAYRLRVSDAMTANPRTVSPETPLDEIVAILVQERFGALLVAGEDDTLIGIVSYIDVLEALTSAKLA